LGWERRGGVSESGDFGFPDDLAELPDGWDYQSLAELVDDERGICYGIVQPGSHTTEGIPIVRVNNIKAGRIDTSDMLRVTEDIESKYARSRLRGGEVLLTLVGSLGESAVVQPELAGWNVARAVGVIPVKKEIGPRWVELCLRSSGIQHFIHTRATTTVQATFNLRDVAKLPVPVPPKREREAIASVLGTLDDKIELNRRMNETLEAIARALFQNWFVDFGPVRAKLDDHRRAVLDRTTAALFPNGLHETKLGHIPHGWAVGRLGDLCTLKRGHDLPASIRTAGAIPVISSSGISGTHNETNVRGPGVVTGRYGTIGKVFFVETDYWPLNTTLYVEDFKGNPARFIFHALGEIDYSNYTDKAAVPGVNRNHLHEEPTVIPPMNVRHAFARIVAPLWSRYAGNNEEARTLAALRDALLPKLLSGELRVPAAKFAEAT
jgi:type I restriction enzyme S subunit